MCKVAQGQVVQEEAEAECSLRNADVVDDTVSCSPPPSPLDSVVIDSEIIPHTLHLSTLIVLVLGYECKHGEREEMREGEGGGRRRRMPHILLTVLSYGFVVSLFSWCL